MNQPPAYSEQDPKSVPPDSERFYSHNTTNIQFSPPTIQENTVVVVPEVIITSFGPGPQPYTCQFCHQSITTRVESETSTKTHLVALCLCCFICWPCAWVPYVMDDCKAKNHYCSNCGAFLGAYDNI